MTTWLKGKKKEKLAPLGKERVMSAKKKVPDEKRVGKVENMPKSKEKTVRRPKWGKRKLFERKVQAETRQIVSGLVEKGQRAPHTTQGE